MKPRQFIILGVGLLILFGGIMAKNYLGSLKEPQPKKKPRESFTKVPVLPVKYQEQETQLSYFGRVGSFQSVALIAEVQGMIQRGSVNLKPGQRVSKGQLLFKIDDRETRLNLQSQKSQFMKSIADILADLQIDYPTSFPTWQKYFEEIQVDKPLAKLPEVKDMKEKTFLSTKGIFSSYYTILAQEERLTKYRSYAPFSGSVSEVFFEPGSVANPGTRIATIQRTSQLELILPVRSEDLKWLTRGTEVNVESEDGSRQWKGKISRIGDQVDPNTQSVNVYVSITTDSKSSIFDGQYLRAILPGNVVQKAMSIPRSAIFDKDKVYLVKDGKLVKSEVTLHKVNPTTAIISGIPEGEQMVKEIPLNAVENLPVKVIK